MQPGDHSLAPTRIALLSDRWLAPHEWNRRGMVTVRMRPTSFERLLADPPEAIVLDPACADARQLADCWQLHNLLRVPLVILAEGATDAEVKALLDRGADEVVTTKPDAAMLAAQVAAILRRSHRADLRRLPQVVTLAGAEIDLISRVVRRDGSTFALSRTEFNLLLAFLHAGGRTCTHHELMARVWGAEYASSTHYLRLYIRYLREKIEDDPRHPTRIINVWGVGYRLAASAPSAPATVADIPVLPTMSRLPVPVDSSPASAPEPEATEWKPRSSSRPPARRIVRASPVLTANTFT